MLSAKGCPGRFIRSVRDGTTLTHKKRSHQKEGLVAVHLCLTVVANGRKLPLWRTAPLKLFLLPVLKGLKQLTENRDPRVHVSDDDAQADRESQAVIGRGDVHIQSVEREAEGQRRRDDLVDDHVAEARQREAIVCMVNIRLNRHAGNAQLERIEMAKADTSLAIIDRVRILLQQAGPDQSAEQAEVRNLFGAVHRDG